jgi:hypothetical protein
LLHPTLHIYDVLEFGIPPFIIIWCLDSPDYIYIPTL